MTRQPSPRGALKSPPQYLLVTMNKVYIDTFGIMIRDVYESKAGFEILERDDDLIDKRNVWEAYFSDYKNWPEDEKKALKYIKGKVLDIGCGAGRHSLYLQNKGHYVIATDISRGAIEVCQKRGLKKVKNISVEKIDRLNEKFETVLLLGNNLGLLQNPAYAKKILKKIDQITTSKTIIIGSTINPYLTKEKVHLDYQQHNIVKGKLAGEMKFRSHYKGYVSEWFNYLFCSPEELAKILSDTSWKIEKIISPKKPIYYAILSKQR